MSDVSFRSNVAWSRSSEEGSEEAVDVEPLRASRSLRSRERRHLAGGVFSLVTVVKTSPSDSSPPWRLRLVTVWLSGQGRGGTMLMFDVKSMCAN